MAQMSDKDTIPLGPFPRGANNIVREDSVPPTAFRRGVNIDVYPRGKLRRRQGKTLVNSTPTRNGWSDGEFALCTSIDSATLYQFDPDVGLTELYTGLQIDSDVVMAPVNHLVYVSDGKRALRVDTTDMSVRPWGVPRPAGQPLLSAIPALGGGLPAGTYQVTITNFAEDGEESGALLAATIDFAGGGIRVQMAAMPVEPHVVGMHVYVTPPGGGDFMRYGSYPIGALDIQITMQRLGVPLRTFGLEVMPAGTSATLAGGRLCVAVDNAMIGSEPMFYGLTNFAKNTVLYAGKIDMLAAAGYGAESPGVFVGAGAKTYFHNGVDFRAATNQLAYNAGAVRGQPVYINGDAFGLEGVPSSPVPSWLAKNGQFCIGLATGQVIGLTNARYVMDSGDRVSIAQRENLGVNQVLIGVREPVGSVARTGDSATATLVRNGIEIP